MTLQVQGVHKYFGGVRAVQGISFEVQPGSCVALIGPNGAGKSTTFACIAGQHAVTQGDILWAGQSLQGLSPGERLACGVARTFQVARVFDALTVEHNVQLLMEPQHSRRMLNVLGRDTRSDVTPLLRSADLLQDAHRRAGSLSYGAKKRLELAMALAGLPTAAGSHAPVPRLLLLDEPAAGLSASERMALMRWVVSLAREPVLEDQLPCAVLYTEHNMDAVFGVADRVLVLMDGQLVAQGSPTEIAGNAMVQSRYLGSSVRMPQAPGEHHA